MADWSCDGRKVNERERREDSKSNVKRRDEAGTMDCAFFFVLLELLSIVRWQKGGEQKRKREFNTSEWINHKRAEGEAIESESEIAKSDG